MYSDIVYVYSELLYVTLVLSPQVLGLEWKLMRDLDAISQKLSERGYVEVARYWEDMLLVKKGSEYEAKYQEVVQLIKQKTSAYNGSLTEDGVPPVPSAAPVVDEDATAESLLVH